MSTKTVGAAAKTKLHTWSLEVAGEGDTGEILVWGTHADAIKWAEKLIRAGDWRGDGESKGCSVSYWLTCDGEPTERTYTVDVEG
jgi:hypothetical protein